MPDYYVGGNGNAIDKVTEICPETVIHISCSDDYRFKFTIPDLLGQTIPSSVTSLTPTLISSGSQVLHQTVMLSEEHVVFQTRDSSYHWHLHWVPINGDPEVDVNITDMGVGNFYGGDRYCMYDDTTVYMLMEDYVADSYDHEVLVKFMFTPTSYSYEIVHTWEWADIYDGVEVTWNTANWLSKFEYGGNEYIALLGDGYGDAPHTRPIRSVVYNVTTDAIVDSGYFDAFDYDANLSNWSYIRATPVFYEGKIVMMINAPNGWQDWPSPPYPDIVMWRLLIVTLSTGVVSFVDGDARYPRWCSLIGATLDYTTDTYWAQMWIDDGVDQSTYWLSADMTLLSSIELGSEIGTSPTPYHIQGINHGYGIQSKTTGETTRDLYEISSLDVLNTILCLNDGWDDAPLESEIDIDNDMIWNLLMDKLEGKALDGGTTRDITFTTPLEFTYASGHHKYLKFLDGICIAIIQSYQSSPSLYQNDVYILRQV